MKKYCQQNVNIVNIWISLEDNELRLRALRSLRPVLWTWCAQVRQRSVGSTDLQCRLEIRANICFSYTTFALRKWYFKNPHPKRPHFASEFPWLIYPGWHCCAVPDGTPPAYNSVVHVGGADSRCCCLQATHLWLKGVYSHTLDVAPN